MDDKIFDQIHDVDLKKTMETSYIDYFRPQGKPERGVIHELSV